MSHGAISRVKVFIVSPYKEPQEFLKLPRKFVRKGKEKSAGTCRWGSILGDKVLFCAGPLQEKEPEANPEQLKAVKARNCDRELSTQT